MKGLKRAVLPVLTCFLVLGAALLPARLSQAVDGRQFDRVHTEARDAATLPVREPLTLTDRISLYAGRFTEGYPALFSQANAYYEDAEGEAVAQETQELLIEAGIVPDWFFREEPFDYVEVNRLLLWDPEAGAAAGEPCYFWEITWPYYSNPYHTKSIHAVLDGESGLPVYLWINDTNMAGWMPGGEEALQQQRERFLGLLGLEAGEAVPGRDSEEGVLELRCSIAGTPLRFLVSRFSTAWGVEPEIDRGETSSAIPFDASGE